MFRDDITDASANVIEVAMPIGLYTSCEVSAPCGLCSPAGIIGLLDVPGTFLNPDRMNAGLMWFTRGFVEYQFPNNARLAGREVTTLEFSLELSSEVPGTSADWPSDITVAINGKEVGAWTSPGDFGDKRGVYTPDWWKLKGSQYGKLKSWRVTPEGTFVDGMKISSMSLRDLDLSVPSFDSPQDRGEARRSPSRRGEYLRARLRQLRPGHYFAADDRAVRGRPLSPFSRGRVGVGIFPRHGATRRPSSGLRPPSPANSGRRKVHSQRRSSRSEQMRALGVEREADQLAGLHHRGAVAFDDQLPRRRIDVKYRRIAEMLDDRHIAL